MGKARLGRIVRQKTATCVAVTEVPKENQADLDNLIKVFKAQYNDNANLRREWGGGLLGHKSRLAKEAKKRPSKENKSRRALSEKAEKNYKQEISSIFKNQVILVQIPTAFKTVLKKSFIFVFMYNNKIKW